MTKKELIETLNEFGLHDDTHIHVWFNNEAYTDFDIDMLTAIDPLPCSEPVAFICPVHEDSDSVLVSEGDMHKMAQALRLAEMFFLATPIGVIEKMGNPLGKVLGEAVGVTTKYTD